MYPWFWIILFVVLLIVEAGTLSLTTIWFAGGAFVACIVSMIWDNRLPEFIVFFVVSFALLFFVRPSALRRFNRRRTRTNVEAVIGRTVRIVEKVDNLADTGRARLDGMEWAAVSINDDQTLSVGEFAVVERVEGVKLVLRNKSI
ncbi:MAG: NfeD family protein [Lachnospiraceae bacterium]|nr:NfeD family protein [Lachnospiraceae bacterium]